MSAGRSQDVDPVGGHDDRVGVAEAADLARVEPGLDREDHPGLDDGVVADVEERRLVVPQPDRVADVLPPVWKQIVLLEVGRAQRCRPRRRWRPAGARGSDLLGGDMWSKRRRSRPSARR